MLYARSDIGEKDELAGDPKQFEEFVHTETIDVAEYPPGYDPKDPQQPVIEPVIVRVTLSIEPTAKDAGTGKSFDHISRKEAVKLLKETVQGLKD